jgi:hypothetical protein
VTTHLSARLIVTAERGRDEYRFHLSHAARDTLVFTDERFRFTDSSLPTEPPPTALGAGHREARIVESAESGDATAQAILGMLRRLFIY